MTLRTARPPLAAALALLVAVGLAAPALTTPVLAAPAATPGTATPAAAPAATPGTAAAVPKATAFTVSPTLFGMHPGPVSYPVAPASAVRLWDAGTGWFEIQTGPSTYRWATLDAQVAKARAAGIRDIMLVLGSAPTWAALSRNGTDLPVANAASPVSATAWERWVTSVILRYRGKVTSFQVWNEASLTRFWRGTPDQMADLTARAYRIIKRYSPASVVVSAGTTMRLASSYDRFFRPYLAGLARRGWPVDVFAVHAYPPGTGTPATRAALLTRFKADLRAARAPSARPVWETELNYGLAGPGSVPGRDLGAATQQAWIAQSYLDALRLGVGRVYWYAWGPARDLLGVTTWVGSPATRALANLRAWLVGARWSGCQVTGVLVRCSLTSGGKVQQILWTTSGAAATRLPTGLRTVCSVAGGCRVLPARSALAVGAMPVRLSA